jgi:hypothetical protein
MVLIVLLGLDESWRCPYHTLSIEGYSIEKKREET